MTNEPEFDCLELLRESNVLALPGGSLKIQDFAAGVTLVFNSDGILLDEMGNPKDDPYYWLEP